MNKRYDVVVVGAGSAGSSAAISAARLGARTLLLDRLPFLGGTSTAVLDTFYAFYTPGEKARRVVGGIGWEVAERLKAEGMAFERPNTYGAGTGVTYDPEVLKVVWERLAEDAQVDVPPRKGRRSSSSVRAPSRAELMAAEVPAEPAPTTTTS